MSAQDYQITIAEQNTEILNLREEVKFLKTHLATTTEEAEDLRLELFNQEQKANEDKHLSLKLANAEHKNEVAALRESLAMLAENLLNATVERELAKAGASDYIADFHAAEDVRRREINKIFKCGAEDQDDMEVRRAAKRRHDFDEPESMEGKRRALLEEERTIRLKDIEKKMEVVNAQRLHFARILSEEARELKNSESPDSFGVDMPNSPKSPDPVQDEVIIDVVGLDEEDLLKENERKMEMVNAHHLQFERILQNEARFMKNSETPDSSVASTSDMPDSPESPDPVFDEEIIDVVGDDDESIPDYLFDDPAVSVEINHYGEENPEYNENHSIDYLCGGIPNTPEWSHQQVTIFPVSLHDGLGFNVNDALDWRAIHMRTWIDAAIEEDEREEQEGEYFSDEDEDEEEEEDEEDEEEEEEEEEEVAPYDFRAESRQRQRQQRYDDSDSDDEAEAEYRARQAARRARIRALTPDSFHSCSSSSEDEYEDEDENN